MENSDKKAEQLQKVRKDIFMVLAQSDLGRKESFGLLSECMAFIRCPGGNLENSQYWK